jgi:Zn-dependent protease with chaperone function
MRTETGYRQRVPGRSGFLLTVPSLLVSAAFVIGYFVLPFTSALTAGTVTVLLVGIALITGSLVWQIRAIRVSPYPRARAMGTLLLTVPLFLVVFATVYYVMGRAEPTSWSEPLSRLDALYFAVTTFATVGFGDIHAVSEDARAVVTIQMIGDLVLIGLITRVVVRAVQEGLARREARSR